MMVEVTILNHDFDFRIGVQHLIEVQSATKLNVGDHVTFDLFIGAEGCKLTYEVMGLVVDGIESSIYDCDVLYRERL